MVLTLGTGIGTALFVDGRLLPEYGARPPRGARHGGRASRLGARCAPIAGSTGRNGPPSVNEVLAAYHALLWPDVFIIGGGVTEHWEHFGPLLHAAREIVPAHFRKTRA